MTEHEWMNSSNPKWMLEYLRRKSFSRKLRLFAVACSLRIWNSLDESARSAIQSAELFADGLLDEDKRQGALTTLMNNLDAEIIKGNNTSKYFFVQSPTPTTFIPALTLMDKDEMLIDSIDGRAIIPLPQDDDGVDRALKVSTFTQLEVAKQNTRILLTNRSRGGRLWATMIKSAQNIANEFFSKPLWDDDTTEEVYQANLLRDLFGPTPFRNFVFEPAWLTSTTVALARAIHKDREFSKLPILADAFEDAGCNNEELLTHCRSALPHVHGCWAIELINNSNINYHESI